MLILTWISGPGQHSPQASSTESGASSVSILDEGAPIVLELAVKAVALTVGVTVPVPVSGSVIAPVAAISLMATAVSTFGVKLSFFRRKLAHLIGFITAGQILHTVTFLLQNPGSGVASESNLAIHPNFFTRVKLV